MKENQNETDFLSVDEVAGRLRISKATVHKAIKTGELLGYKFGNKFRIKISDMEKYLQRKKTGSDE